MWVRGRGGAGRSAPQRNEERREESSLVAEGEVERDVLGALSGGQAAGRNEFGTWGKPEGEADGRAEN